MPEQASLSGFVAAARARVDAALETCLPRPPACPDLISAATRYSVFAGGKRLRPVLSYAAADAIVRAASGRPADEAALAAATPAACAIELIHTYSLIHDDLPAMDNDTMRRGQPTAHVVFGDGIAILAGDALQAEAFAVLTRGAVDDSALCARRLRVTTLIAAAAGACGMVGGQVIDLQAAGQVPGHGLTLDGAGLQQMHLRKTGALISAATVSGAVLAGGDAPQIAAIETWSRHLGLAFQIVDDILDVEGSASHLGKSAGKDAAAAKPTYPSLFGLERSGAMARNCAEQAASVLAGAGLTDGWLGAIADWIITRRN